MDTERIGCHDKINLFQTSSRAGLWGWRGWGRGGGEPVEGEPERSICIFCSENEISIQPAALWTPQVPWFHRCKPFTKTHLKKKKKGKKKEELTASSRLTVAKAMTSCELRTCLFIGAGLLSGSAQGGWRVPWKGPRDSHLQTCRC